MASDLDCYPFHLVAATPKAVTDEELSGALLPLVHGTHAILKAMAEAYRVDLPSEEELENSLRLLAGVTGLATDLLTRWHDTKPGKRGSTAAERG